MNILDLLTSLEDRPFIQQILLQYFLFMVICVIIRIGYVILNPGKLSLRHSFRYFVGMAYLNFVLALTLTPLHLNYDVGSMLARTQLVPFDTVTRYWPMDGEYSLYNIVGNFLMMFPMLPVLTYSFRVKSIKIALLFTAFFIIMIEIMQLVLTTTRTCDIDDFILNFSGFVLTIFIWKIIQRIRLAN